MYQKLPKKFYLNKNVVEIAKKLVGKILVTELNGLITAGKIVETEAYCGRDDKACHASKEKRTARTEMMYAAGGCAYVYLCYGIHHLFNVVTNSEGMADAVLIRALEPLEGIDIMKERRNFPKSKLSSGPGTLSQALGIQTKMNGMDLTKKPLWIGKNINNEAFEILSDKRIGVDYAGEDSLKPWRFIMAGNKFVSKGIN